MTALSWNVDYVALLAKCPPRIIRTEEENERFTEFLYEMDMRPHKRTRAERELSELLTMLIEEFEEKHYALPRAAPLDALRFLMEQHSLKQKDLIDVFGSASIVSEVLHGKREMNKEHIRRLSERFQVSPELFF